MLRGTILIFILIFTSVWPVLALGFWTYLLHNWSIKMLSWLLVRALWLLHFIELHHILGREAELVWIFRLEHEHWTNQVASLDVLNDFAADLVCIHSKRSQLHLDLLCNHVSLLGLPFGSTGVWWDNLSARHIDLIAVGLYKLEGSTHFIAHLLRLLKLVI